MAHKGHTANKKETLQLKNKHCKKKDMLQIKNECRKQKKYAANKRELIMRVHSVKGTGQIHLIVSVFLQILLEGHRIYQGGCRPGCSIWFTGKWVYNLRGL